MVVQTDARKVAQTTNILYPDFRCNVIWM